MTDGEGTVTEEGSGTVINVRKGSVLMQLPETVLQVQAQQPLLIWRASGTFQQEYRASVSGHVRRKSNVAPQ